MRVETTDEEINIIIGMDEAQDFALALRQQADQTGGPNGERFRQVASELYVAMSNYNHRTGRTL